MITSHDETIFQDDCFGQERLFSNDGKPLDVGSASPVIRKPLPLEDPIGGPLGRFAPRQMPGSWDNPFPADAHIAQPPIEVEVVPPTDGILDLDQLLDKPVGVKDNSKDSRLNNLGSSTRERRRRSKSFSRLRPRPWRKDTSKYKDLPKEWSRKTYSDTTDDGDDHGSVFFGDDMSEEEPVVPRQRAGRREGFDVIEILPTNPRRTPEVHQPRRNSFANEFPMNHSPVRPYEPELVIEREWDRRGNADRHARQETRRRREAEEEVERVRLAAARERERRRRAQELAQQRERMAINERETRRSPRFQYPHQTEDTKYNDVSFAALQDPVMTDIIKKWTNLEVGFPVKSGIAQPPLSGPDSTVIEPK
jgi:hypothetical protein